MAIRARIPRPRSVTAARRGRETPPVSASCGGVLAAALADGLADALADELMEALAEDEAEDSSLPDTVTLPVISGWIVH